MPTIHVEYNSTYVSINLIDELDYIIGGYGKPNSIFVYSLNAFLESFVLNSNFYISDQEASHFQLLSKSLFPNGRPILEMLGRTGCLMAVGGIGNNIAKVVSIEKFEFDTPSTYQDRIHHFIEHGLDTSLARSKYLVIPEISYRPPEPTYLNVSKVEGGFVGLESQNSPERFYRRLCDAAKPDNVQATLPFYSYGSQIEDVRSRGLAKEMITNLTGVFLAKQKKIEDYFGVSNQTIPPLVTILLSQCNAIHDIPDRILQLRADFSRLRDAIIKYEKKINDADKIKDQLEAIDEVNEFWRIFNKRYSNNTRLLYQFWEIGKDADYEKSIDNSIDKRDLSNIVSDLNLGKVAGKGAEKAVSWYRERRIINRFRGITDMWQLFESGPSLRRQLPLFEKVFNVKIDENELMQLNSTLSNLANKYLS